MSDRLARERRWQIAGVFLVVLAARWWLISSAGFPVPFWDQWYSDVHDVRAVADGNFWRGTFDAHNEHRIVFTRLLNRSLLWIDGQWDPLAQMYAAALVHAAAAAALAGWLGAGLPRTSAGLLAITVAALYALPHAWQNTLWGFQSQFSFLLLFSIACLAWLGRADGPREWRWWLGLAAGAAANLAMAAGAVTGATLIAVAVWELARRRTWFRAAGWRLLAGFALIAFAWTLRAPVPGHEQLQIASTSQFAAVLISALAWPNQDLPLLFSLANAPLLILAVRTLTRPGKIEATHRTMFLAGAWGALQAVAFALARGGAAAHVFEAASRYHDLWAVLAAANALAVVWWMGGTAFHTTRQRRLAMLAAGIWTAVFVGGLVLINHRVLHTEIASRRRDPGLHTRVVTALQRGIDPEKLYAQLPPAFRSWQPPDMIRHLVDDPAFAGWLPPELQTPVDLTWTDASPEFLAADLAPEDPVPPGFYPQWGTWRGTSGDFPAGRAESAPFTLTDRAYEFACLRGGNPAAVNLTLRQSGSERSLELPVAAIPEKQWRPLVLVPGAGRWTLSASVNSPDAWLVFSGPRLIRSLARITRAGQQYDTMFATATVVGGLLLLSTALPASTYGAIRSTSRNNSASGAQPRSGNT